MLYCCQQFSRLFLESPGFVWGQTPCRHQNFGGRAAVGCDQIAMAARDKNAAVDKLLADLLSSDDDDVDQGHHQMQPIAGENDAHYVEVYRR